MDEKKEEEEEEEKGAGDGPERPGKRGPRREAEGAEGAEGGEGGEGLHVVIEHWSAGVYGRRAEALSRALSLAAPDLPVLLNPTKPRRNSFEVTLLRPDGTRTELWSGIKKGPPRRLKFPEPELLADLLKSNLA
uniref:Selenoprotein H n=1 Tax=Ornithorhynchus anatinus TaxID=9258 RepID=A0A6I8NXV9_ORNAN